MQTSEISQDLYKDWTPLTEQEMSLVAAQAVGFAGTWAPVAVFVTWMAFPVLVCILMRWARVGWWHTVAVALQPLTLSAAATGASMGPEAGTTRCITVCDNKEKVTESKDAVTPRAYHMEHFSLGLIFDIYYSLSDNITTFAMVTHPIWFQSTSCEHVSVCLLSVFSWDGNKYRNYPLSILLCSNALPYNVILLAATV